MKYLFLSLLLILIGCSSTSSSKRTSTSKNLSSTDFTCTLRALSNIYENGEIPEFEVEIKNISTQDVILIGSIDGSDLKVRMPYCYFTIEKPESASEIIFESCGVLNSLEKDDFVLVESGSIFDPYDGFWNSSEITNHSTFETAGTYKIQFHYSTLSNSDEDFYGWPPYEKFYKKDIKRMLQRVPKIELSSNVVEIEIK